jgi:meso-butanediol dehydrogenase / (S,S)-butanediol dehydrogenase / diacetyl reductase
MTHWESRVVLVTGGASGIGQATAVRFAREGAFVALLDRNVEGMQATVGAIGDSEQVLPLPADLLDEPAVVCAVAQAAAWKGRLDAVVNVAGICPSEDYLDAPRSHWDAVVQINLRGTYVVGREGARAMMRDGGAIVNVSSALGIVGDPSLIAYCATKGGVAAMTRAMALKLAPHGIRVNSISPGGVATPLFDDWVKELDDPAGYLARYSSLYPLGYYLQPEDAAGPIVFLAGPDARCITGTNLVVDCGLTIRGDQV